jgi:hypothetical protein
MLTRTMMSVGDMPCVGQSASNKQRNRQGEDTHVDLGRNGHEDRLRGVRDREEDDKDELHGEEEQARLDDDADGALHRAGGVRDAVEAVLAGDVPYAPDDEGGDDEVEAEGEAEAGGADGDDGGGRLGRCRVYGEDEANKGETAR